MTRSRAPAGVHGLLDERPHYLISTVSRCTPGYGLTYADIRVLAASAEKATDGGLVVRAQVQNLGAVASEDVVQLYLKAEDSPDSTPNPILSGFARVHLDAGEAKEVALQVAPASLSVVDDAGSRLFPGGRYSLYAGTSQPDARSRALTGCFTREAGDSAVRRISAGSPLRRAAFYLSGVPVTNRTI